MTEFVEASIGQGLCMGGNAASWRHGGVFDYTFRTTKLDEIEQSLLNFIASPHTHVPTTRGNRIDGTFRFHGMGDLVVFDLQYGRELAVRYDDQPPDRLAFIIAPQGAGQVEWADRHSFVSRRHAVAFVSGEAKALHYTEECNTQVLLLNRRKIASSCAKLLGRDIVEDVEFEASLDLSDMGGESWLRLFEYVSAELSAPHSLIRGIPAAQQQLEQMVIAGFLLNHRNNYSEALLRPQSAAAPFYVKRAEAFIEAHYAAPLSLVDIAAHAGVSARSLQSGFQNFRGMTPMAFLRSVRFQHVHHALLAADPVTMNVTQIALACGFTHLGQFRTIYKRMFGETPGRTLQRSIRS